MTQPHTDEIAALLALPPAAREALAAVAGPGWVLYRRKRARGGPPVEWQAALEHGPERLAFYHWPEKEWLPCDPTAIVAVVASGRGGAWTFDSRIFPEDESVVAMVAGCRAAGSSARLAALRLVAAVYGGGA